MVGSCATLHVTAEQLVPDGGRSMGLGLVYRPNDLTTILEGRVCLTDALHAEIEKAAQDPCNFSLVGLFSWRFRMRWSN
jgi:hypothetical protein